MKYYTMRLLTAALTFIVGVTSATLVHSPRHGTASDDGTTEEILQIEKEYYGAHINRDIETLDRLLADDFTAFRGRVRKSQRLALVANPDFTISAITVKAADVQFEGDVAWVNGTAKMSSRFQAREYTSPDYQFTRRYEKREGRWQIVSLEVAPRW